MSECTKHIVFDFFLIELRPVNNKRLVVSGQSGVKVGEQFGPKYFKKWWDRACTNLGIQGVDLYGGTKHSTATALGELLTPEEIKRGGTGSATNKAFERYFQPRRTESLKVTSAIRQLQKKGKKEGKVVELRKENRITT